MRSFLTLRPRHLSLFSSRATRRASSLNHRAETLIRSDGRKSEAPQNFQGWLSEYLEALSSDSTDRRFKNYAESLRSALRSPASQGNGARTLREKGSVLPERNDWHPLIALLRLDYFASGKAAVHDRINYAYHNASKVQAELQKSDVDILGKLIDLRFPYEQYAEARALPREIHLHVGPTNSGKTYQALKRLEAAKSGVYAGPLRLLAHEVHSRFIQEGRACDLVTGDERILSVNSGSDPPLTSCTVEMVPLKSRFDVAVIDEVQLVSDTKRGAAWTAAILGLKARELHLCGEERVVPLIKELAALLGDKCHVHKYSRLSPLKPMTQSLKGLLSDLRKGDCFVCFSRVAIHAKKKEIEQATGRRVAIVYGGLPAEVRASQARLFNDPNNDYDILVASDAVGMGLNLAIKRIIFESMMKYTGTAFELMPTAQIKQIAGRAGRFRVAPQAVSQGAEGEGPGPVPAGADTIGLATTFNDMDLPALRQAMFTDAEPITAAGIHPSMLMIEECAAQFPPSTPLGSILRWIQESAIVSKRFFFCSLETWIANADTIEQVEGLSMRDRLLLCTSPAQVRKGLHQVAMTKTLTAFAMCVANSSSGRLLDIDEIGLEVLDEPLTASRLYVERLEALHLSLILYLWLGYRICGVFIDREMAQHVRKLVETRISQALAQVTPRSVLSNGIQQGQPQGYDISLEQTALEAV